jgi:hypothetical protein
MRRLRLILLGEGSRIVEDLLSELKMGWVGDALSVEMDMEWSRSVC